MVQAPTSLTHWGAFTAAVESGDIAAVTPLNGDTDPSAATRQPARFYPASVADSHPGGAPRLVA